MSSHRVLIAILLLAGCGGTVETSGAGASSASGGTAGSGGASGSGGTSGSAGVAGSGGSSSDCPPPPGPMDCVDPCTGAMYGPSCVNGSWVCSADGPDGGCPDAGNVWGCSTQTSPSGEVTCTCASPVPPGDPVEPSTCAGVPQGSYVCCELDLASGLCSCVSTGYCAAGQVSSCEFAYTCPDQQVTPSTMCDVPGASCPGTGSDPYCWDWTCVCQDTGTFGCSPGVCS